MLYPRPPFLIPYRLILGYLFLSALAIAGSSLYAFFRSASPLARQRAKVVLAGAAVAFPVPALAQYLSLFGGVPIQNNFLAIPMIAFPWESSARPARPTIVSGTFSTVELVQAPSGFVAYSR